MKSKTLVGIVAIVTILLGIIIISFGWKTWRLVQHANHQPDLHAYRDCQPDTDRHIHGRVHAAALRHQHPRNILLPGSLLRRMLHRLRHIYANVVT
jgi:hypothetical protein